LGYEIIFAFVVAIPSTIAAAGVAAVAALMA
jgi:hypothetical protein